MWVATDEQSGTDASNDHPLGNPNKCETAAMGCISTLSCSAYSTTSGSSAQAKKRGWIILISNKHVRASCSDEILTTAILGCLLHPVHIVHIDGPSYRRRVLCLWHEADRALAA